MFWDVTYFALRYTLGSVCHNHSIDEYQHLDLHVWVRPTQVARAQRDAHLGHMRSVPGLKRSRDRDSRLRTTCCHLPRGAGRLIRSVSF